MTGPRPGGLCRFIISICFHQYLMYLVPSNFL
jgi:hypothetical protein